MSSLLLARSEAIKRNTQVAVVPVADDWTKGWVVEAVVTGEQYDKRNPVGDVVINLAPASIVYDRNGRLTVPGTTHVEIADPYARVPARCVVIELSGLPRLLQGICL